VIYRALLLNKQIIFLSQTIKAEYWFGTITRIESTVLSFVMLLHAILHSS